MHNPFVIPLAVISMPMPYHQSQEPIHFGVANPQIQTHGVSTAPFQIPLAMPFPIVGVAQVQQFQVCILILFVHKDS